MIADKQTLSFTETRLDFALSVYLAFLERVVFDSSGAAGSGAEMEGGWCSNYTGFSTQARFVWRSISCIHRKHPYWKQIFPDSWFESKPSWNDHQLLWPAHRGGGRSCGRGSFETHLPHLTGWGVLPSLAFLFYDHRLFLCCTVFFPPLFSPNCLPFLHMHGSCFTAEWCLVFQMSTHGSLPGRRSYPNLCSSVGVHAEQWSDGTARGPNINTACDTPSHNAFKPSIRRP